LGLLEEHGQRRKEKESKLIAAIEEKTEEIHRELLRERTGDEREAMLGDLPMLKENLGILVSEREEMEQSLIRQTSEEFDRIREDLEEERRARELGEDEIANLVREVTLQLQERVLVEKAERERMEESILELLEETCTRLSNTSNL
jgi:hypothetical protein